jgi:hypothetical protein
VASTKRYGIKADLVNVRMAQWIRRLPTEQEILGSSPSTDYTLFPSFLGLIQLFFCLHARQRCAQTDQPCLESFVMRVEWTKKVIEQKKGVMRESNSRPPAPEAGIIPLDQSPESQHVTAQRRDMNAGAKEKGRAGVEPATYRAATNCSTTELTPQQQC